MRAFGKRAHPARQPTAHLSITYRVEKVYASKRSYHQSKRSQKPYLCRTTLPCSISKTRMLPSATKLEWIHPTVCHTPNPSIGILGYQPPSLTTLEKWTSRACCWMNLGLIFQVRAARRNRPITTSTALSLRVQSLFTTGLHSSTC